MGRIYELPRRDWRDEPEDSIRELTEALRAPGGTQELRTIQAVFVLEVLRCGGGWLNGRVGCGKTLISILLATLFEDHQPLIFVPGGLEEKTEREFDGYRKHWKLTHKYNIATYSDLSRDEEEELLNTYNPRIVICDEVDKLRRVTESGCAKRVAHWMAKKPGTLFVGMTGTPFKEGLKDFAHVLNWGLKDGSPAPLMPADITRWDKALRGKGSGVKVANELQIDRDSDERALRAAFRDRLFSTPGCVISTDQFTGVPLSIRTADFDAGTGEELRKLRRTGERPDGWDTVDEDTADADNGPGSTWAAERQLALGFYYTPDPKPPKAWMQARKNWFSFVRTQLQSGRYNTELQVRKAAARGTYGQLKVWLEWERLKPTFEPSFVPVWLRQDAIDYCLAWGAGGPGIIWTDHRAFADRLSQESGWDWYAGGGLTSDGRRIEDASRHSTIIASRQANGTGRNLQAWSRGLITAMPGNGRDFEQQLGRQHREGALTGVDITVLLGCGAHRRDVGKVLALSEEEQELFGRQNKALTAAWI